MLGSVPKLAWSVASGLVANPAATFRYGPSLFTKGRSRVKSYALQVHGRRFLADFYDAAREAGARPFLMWGTLLGCLREGDFIRHDTDIDIGMLSGDYDKKDVLIAAMQRRGYLLGYDMPYKFRVQRRDSLHIDVEFFYPDGDSVICIRRGKSRTIGNRFPRDTFDRLRPAIFADGLDVLVPQSAEALLTLIYGNWRTPDPGYDASDVPGIGFTLPVDAALPPFVPMTER